MPGLRVDERTLVALPLTSAVAVACRAFYDDPFYRFLFPHEAWRAKGLTALFHATLAHMGPGGRVMTVRDEVDAIVGVAAWLPTDCYPQSFRTQLAQLPGTLRATYRRPRTFLDGNAYLVSTARNHPKEPHWHLMMLATDPPMQRRGIGTMVLE